MKDEQDIIITLGKMNNRYERFNLVDDSFTLEMKDLETNINIKLIVSKRDKNKNQLYRLNVNKNTSKNIVIYQKVNAVTFHFLVNWISLHFKD